MTNYANIVKYLDILKRISARGVVLSDEILKIFSFEEELKNRVDNPLFALSKDAVACAAEKLNAEISSADEVEMDKKILSRCGVRAEPWEILYDKKEIVPSRMYVLAFFVDYNGSEDPTGHPRCGGEGERFYGSGNAKTRSEFWDELIEIYNGCEWTQPVSVSDIMIENQKIIYDYRGRVYIKNL